MAENADLLATYKDSNAALEGVMITISSAVPTVRCSRRVGTLLVCIYTG